MSEENNVIYCGQCGSKNPATFKFCSNCGAKLEKPQEDAFAYGKEDPVFSGEQVQPAVEKVVAEIVSGDSKSIMERRRGIILPTVMIPPHPAIIPATAVRV